jgi:nucleoside-diphosphate-sugar epimerase
LNINLSLLSNFRLICKAYLPPINKQEAEMAKTVVVLGAAGRIGKAAAQAFLDAGYRVKAATRDGRAVLPGTEPVKADAMSIDQLRAAFAGADVIFNGLNPLYPEWKTVALPMARNIMDAMRGSGALHLFPGNVYGFGSPMPPVLREDTPQKPTAVKGQIRVDMEQLFRKEAQTHGTRTIVAARRRFFRRGQRQLVRSRAHQPKLAKGQFFSAPGQHEPAARLGLSARPCCDVCQTAGHAARPA